MAERILDARKAHAAGTLGRDDLWRQMQAAHLLLRDYQALLAEVPVDAITITAEALVVTVPGGLRFRWNPEDIRTAPNILLSQGAYEPGEMALMRRVAARGGVMLDVGANIGWYSLHLAPLLDAVYAFEPVPGTHEELVANLALNDAGARVTPVPVALGEAPGEARFFVPRFTGSVAASARPLFPEDEQTEVAVTVSTIDAEVAARGIDRVSFIKADVEGAELFALQGGLATIRRDRPVLVLEMLRKWAKAYDYHPDAIIALLAGLGYVCRGLDGGALVPVERVDEGCTMTNFVFLHPETHGDLLG